MVTAYELASAGPPKLEAALAALDPAAPLSERLDAVEDLARWIIDAGGLKRLRRPEPVQLLRLGQALATLRARPELAQKLSATVAAIFRDTTAVALFADAGIPGDRGLVREAIDRIATHVLPQPPDDENLERFVSRVFRSPRDCAWIAQAPPSVFAELHAVLGDVWGPVRAAMADAVALLCTRVSALGLSAALRNLAEPMQVRDSPFFRLPLVSLEELPLVMLECRRQLEIIHTRLETTGVSVDVVHRLDTIRRMFRRIDRMLPFITHGGTAETRLAAAQALLGALTHGRIVDQSLRQLGRENLGLLARKVIERAGHSGEHYVTTSRREYLRMLASAAGGGALTAFTVIGKFLASWAHFAPFVDGMLVAANDGGSFLAMQFLGLTLASKQPSMTAAALAATIRESKGAHQLDELVALIARISRSQLAAAIGNIFTVILMAIALDLVWVGTTGHHFLDAQTAAATIASNDLRHSGTIFYAVLTGVLLWISSLGAGWLENWVTYRRLPDAIRESRLGRTAGRARMQRIADFVVNHSAGIGGNVTLGVLLGIVPAIGIVTGLPLDVRHVTLASGSQAFAFAALGPSALTASAVISIAVIGICNFGVSFALALAVALRAREVTGSERLGLLVAVIRRFARHPLEFLVPPRA